MLSVQALRRHIDVGTPLLSQRFWLAAIVAFSLTIATACGDPPPPTPVPDAPASPAAPTFVEQTLSTMIQSLLVDSIPREYDNHKDWGKTKPIVNGLKLERGPDGLQLMEHKKVVNNGLWKEYHVTLLDPQQELQVRLAGLRAGQPGHTLLQLVLVDKVRGQARLEDWKDGVKLFTLTSDADCKLEADLGFDVAWSWKPGSVLGDLVVEPKVTTLDLKLLEFQLNKVSKIEGWTARQLGDAIEGTVSHELHQQQPRLVAKINAAIDKKKDKLHFSPDQALTSGLGKLETLLRPTDAPAKQ